MQPRSMLGNQPQSQPILPSQRSPYFRNGAADRSLSHNRGRLSPLPPRPSRLVAAVTAPLRGQQRSQQQPHPFFAQGPAAMGYIPQQTPRYPRYPYSSPQEPIIPLRTQFAAASSARGSSHRHIALPLPELEQTRPSSVPSQYTQSARTGIEIAGPIIQRPTSVAYTSTHSSLALNHTGVNQLYEQHGEESGHSLPRLGFPDDTSFNNDDVSPKHIPTILVSKRTRAQLMSKEHSTPSSKTSSRSSNVTPAAAQHANQRSAKKKFLVRTAATNNHSAPQSEPLDVPATSENKISQKRLQDDVAKDETIPKRPTKIKLVTRHAILSKSPASREHNTTVAAPTPANDIAPLGSSLSQTSANNSQGDMMCGSPGPIGSMTDITKIATVSSEAWESPQQAEAKDTFVAPSPAPEPVYSAFIDPSLTMCHNTSNPEISEDTLSRTAPHHEEPIEFQSNIPPRPAPQRSASQATTVSAASTEPPCATTDRDKDKPKLGDSLNSILTIDETMILENDISDLVTARLREGTADALDAFYAEILIKMAVRDEALFEAVSRMLKS
ncbi:hypothetical protein F4777DRAFT_293713 [Nemania sp. FL0916]|nr:hypothetical protein F4777DRAFT_293713 [Nemania sp. FL0916]